ncbi:MAG: hypothetical protein KGI29_05895 [Pseudomonadota bacterium]|nr:hypothetical protein [Pseudomonadota bacterium]
MGSIQDELYSQADREVARRILLGTEKLNESSTGWQEMPDGNSKMVLYYDHSNDKERILVSAMQEELLPLSLPLAKMEDKTLPLSGLNNMRTVIIQVATGELEAFKNRGIGGR